MLKVVIDTNIIVGGADDESSIAFKIIKEVIDGRIEAFATHQTMGENRQMLRKLVKDRAYRQLLEEFFRKLQIVKPPLHFPLSEGEKERGWIVSDPEDNKLFESAAASGAQYLITNDQEVLGVNEYHGTKIMTPQDFWAEYQAQKGDESTWQDWTKMVMGE